MFELTDKTIAIALLKSIVKRPDVSEEVGHHITTAVCLLDETQREGLDEHDITLEQIRNVAMVLTGDNFMMREPDPSDPQDMMLHRMLSMLHVNKKARAAASPEPNLDDLIKDLFGGSTGE